MTTLGLGSATHGVHFVVRLRGRVGGLNGEMRYEEVSLLVGWPSSLRRKLRTGCGATRG